MKTSYEGRAFLAREEGCVLSAYKDSTGVWTIGLGHTTSAGPPAVTSRLMLTLDECFRLFERDLAKFEGYVNRLLKVTVSQPQFDALVSICYNIGPDIDDDTRPEGLGDSQLMLRLNRGDYEGAANGFLGWKRAGTNPVALKARRERERRLFRSGDYGNIATIPVWEKRGGKVKAMALPKSVIQAVRPDSAPPVQPPPASPAPKPVPLPPSSPASPAGGFWAALIQALLSLFKH